MVVCHEQTRETIWSKSTIITTILAYWGDIIFWNMSHTSVAISTICNCHRFSSSTWEIGSKLSGESKSIELWIRWPSTPNFFCDTAPHVETQYGTAYVNMIFQADGYCWERIKSLWLIAIKIVPTINEVLKAIRSTPSHSDIRMKVNFKLITTHRVNCHFHQYSNHLHKNHKHHRCQVLRYPIHHKCHSSLGDYRTTD